MALTDTKVTFNLYQTLTNVKHASAASAAAAVQPSKRLVDKPVSGVDLVTYMQANFKARTSGLDPTASKPIFTTQNHSAPSYVRNSECWLASLAHKLTAISPWNSRSAHLRAGTAISPRHIIMANHYRLYTSDTIRFITADNQIVTRTITGYEQAGTTDFGVCSLDSDLPDTISFVKAAPANFRSYLTSDSPIGLPVVALDQEEHALVLDTLWYMTTYLLDVLCHVIEFGRSADADRAAFFEDLVVGDSGNPILTLVNGELVLLSTWYSTSNYPGGSGFDLGYYTDEVNAAMASLGGGYQLTECNLSGFALP